MKNNSEATHQKIIFEWAEWQKAKYPELDMLMHTVNEGKRSPRVGAELKKMGMKKGFPDISLLVPKYYKGRFNPCFNGYYTFTKLIYNF